MRRRLIVIGAIACVVLGVGLWTAWRMAGHASLPDGEWEATEDEYVPAEPDTPLHEIVIAREWDSIPDVNILIDKTDFSLAIRSGEETLKTYPVALGTDEFADKQQRGDRQTPEGEFYICQRNMIANSHAWEAVWMRLSYPNDEDAARGLEAGLIDEAQAKRITRAIEHRRKPLQDTNLGSGIGIHAGGIKPRTWTLGCIALQYPHAVEVYEHTKMGTPVTIQR